ncbi:hypothetical protein M977_03954 [Buttiauxella gaviniae ATCC 51604]|uniref:Uncharacterized protein n=1 Tax=Buttiauxella gaviniae ATCC 51604 TaxID=1354253 RepID=A0A1B7HPX1_9ENTR|nr:hypothetical protein M977_03954 [Buttiauxella gaviniae ATCC 51604]
MLAAVLCKMVSMQYWVSVEYGEGGDALGLLAPRTVRH